MRSNGTILVKKTDYPIIIITFAFVRFVVTKIIQVIVTELATCIGERPLFRVLKTCEHAVDSVKRYEKPDHLRERKQR